MQDSEAIFWEVPTKKLKFFRNSNKKKRETIQKKFLFLFLSFFYCLFCKNLSLPTGKTPEESVSEGCLPAIFLPLSLRSWLCNMHNRPTQYSNKESAE